MASPLISAAELREALGTVTILDVRYRLGGPSGPEEYAAGHIPGAAYIDLDGALAAPVRDDRVGGRHPLPAPDTFEAAMRAAGVRGDRGVVVYDDWAGRAAGRAWWLLRDAGHADVRVLDGGYSAWVAADGPVETGSATVVAGDFAARPGMLPRVDASSVASFAGAVVDARAPERFRGDVEPIDPAAGHIPGALNVPTDANLRADGTFRTPGELAALYPEGEIACYCGSGVTACHDILALAVAGRSAVLYPGSWSDWVSDPGRPVATD